MANAARLSPKRGPCPIPLAVVAPIPLSNVAPIPLANLALIPVADNIEQFIIASVIWSSLFKQMFSI